MKQVPTSVYHKLSLEKDDPRNVTGLQLRIWKLDSGLTVLVRFYFPVKKEGYEAWPKHLRKSRPVTDGASFDESAGPPTNVLRILNELGILKDVNNWAFSRMETDRLEAYDEAHEDVGDGMFGYLAYTARHHVTDMISKL